MKLFNDITGATEQTALKIEPKITFLMLTKNSAFANESIHLRFQNPLSGVEKDIIKPMAIKHILPHIGIFNRAATIVDDAGNHIAIIAIANGNIQTSETNRLILDLRNLDSTKVYKLNGIATEQLATFLYQYQFGNLDNQQFSHEVNVRSALSMAIERSFTGLTFTSKQGEVQDYDVNETVAIEAYNRVLGQLQYDTDVLGYVEKTDNYFITPVVNQATCVIKNSSGNAPVAYSLMSVQNL